MKYKLSSENPLLQLSRNIPHKAFSALVPSCISAEHASAVRFSVSFQCLEHGVDMGVGDSADTDMPNWKTRVSSYQIHASPQDGITVYFTILQLLLSGSTEDIFPCFYLNNVEARESVIMPKVLPIFHHKFELKCFSY